MIAKSQGILVLASHRKGPLVLLALLGLASCSQQRLYVQPSQLAAHAEEFQNHGKARVKVEPSGTALVTSQKTLRVRLPGKSKSLLWGLLQVKQDDETMLVSVGQLVANCGTKEPCLAERVHDTPAWISTRQVFDPARAAIGTFGLVATIGSVTCLAVCEEPHNAAYLGAAIAVGTLVYALTAGD